MQTKIYDSDEPGPPHGWLDLGFRLAATDMTIWENVIPVILQARRLPTMSSEASTSEQFWGACG